MSVFSALGRTLGSSTFLSGLLTMAIQAGAASIGIPIPTALAAAIPAAVGFKEAVRRRAEVELAKSATELAHDAAQKELDRAHDLVLAKLKDAPETP